MPCGSADGRVTPDGRWFVCVHEQHGSDLAEAANSLVAVASDGSMRMHPLATGADFYAAPRLSPDGRQVAWIQWMRPNMPWDSTELWVADLADGRASNSRRVVGNGDEALQQPEWHADGTLTVLTDRSNWWNVYDVDLATGELSHRAGADYDIGKAPWFFGYSRGARYAGEPAPRFPRLAPGERAGAALIQSVSGAGIRSPTDVPSSRSQKRANASASGAALAPSSTAPTRMGANTPASMDVTSACVT